MDIPTEHDKKYDRQIRLWGLGGQQALEKAKVCLLNASGSGSETLKNLVLPGVSFVIVDGHVVTEADLGTSFFLTEEDLNRPRGERTAQWLKELNPDVKHGSFLTESPEHVIETNPDYFRQEGFTVVVASQLPEATVVRLAVTLERDGIPLVVVRSYGLFGFVRVQSPHYAVLETFPDQPTEDLRLADPFPELAEYVDAIGSPDAVTDSLLHAHIPYVALLVHYYRQWKQQSGHASGPLSFPQRKEIRALVEAGRRIEEKVLESGEKKVGVADEDNFKEAVAALHKLNPPALPEATRRLLDHPRATALDAASEPFWVAVAALRDFHARHGVLPITGKIQDLTSTTELFVSLQQCYQRKAQRDLDELTALAASLAAAAGAKPPPADFLATFAKNVWSVRYAEFRSIAAEVTPATARLDALKGLRNDVPWYLLLRSGDRFHREHGAFPGSQADDWEADVPRLETVAQALLAELGIAEPLEAAQVQEWVRYGGSELHTVSAVVGGVAAQEVIKLITQQRVPLNNTLVFNGIEGTFSTNEF